MFNKAVDKEDVVHTYSGILLSRLCNPIDYSPPGSMEFSRNSPGKNTGVGCHLVLQGILRTQGLNLGLLHCSQILYHLSHQGSPITP